MYYLRQNGTRSNDDEPEVRRVSAEHSEYLYTQDEVAELMTEKEAKERAEKARAEAKIAAESRGRESRIKRLLDGAAERVKRAVKRILGR